MHSSVLSIPLTNTDLINTRPRQVKLKKSTLQFFKHYPFSSYSSFICCFVTTFQAARTKPDTIPRFLIPEQKYYECRGGSQGRHARHQLQISSFQTISAPPLPRAIGASLPFSFNWTLDRFDQFIEFRNSHSLTLTRRYSRGENAG